MLVHTTVTFSSSLHLGLTFAYYLVFRFSNLRVLEAAICKTHHFRVVGYEPKLLYSEVC